MIADSDYDLFEVLFMRSLFYGLDKVITQMQNEQAYLRTELAGWIFWSFVPIGAACMILHFIEFYLDELWKGGQ
ncbi:MAG: hypothetical protein ACLR8P_02880 [Clostridium fessum]